MSEASDIEKAFHETLLAIGEDYLKHLVVVGGWCPYLYSKYLWTVESPFPRTTDIDFAVRETTPLRFSVTMFQKLSTPGFGSQKMNKDDFKFQLFYKDKNLKVPIDFITAYENRPDGCERFLGREINCAPLEGVDVLLASSPIHLNIPFGDRSLAVDAAAPAAFLYAKGLSFDTRVVPGKGAKDLASIAYLLTYCPDREEIARDVLALREHELFEGFQETLAEYLGKPGAKGYRLLRPFFQEWGFGSDNRTLDRVIQKTFFPLLDLPESK